MTEVECHRLDDHVAISFASPATRSKHAEKWLFSRRYNGGYCDPAASASKVTAVAHYERGARDHPKAPKGRSRDEHRFPDRKDHFWRLLVDGKFQPLQEPQLHERVREGEGNSVSKAGSGGNRR